MNTQPTKPTKCRLSEIPTCISAQPKKMSIRSIALGLGIIGLTAAIGAIIGAVTGALMNDLASGLAWGIAAGAGLPAILIVLSLDKMMPPALRGPFQKAFR